MICQDIKIYLNVNQVIAVNLRLFFLFCYSFIIHCLLSLNCELDETTLSARFVKHCFLIKNVSCISFKESFSKEFIYKTVTKDLINKVNINESK